MQKTVSLKPEVKEHLDRAKLMHAKLMGKKLSTDEFIRLLLKKWDE